MNRQCRSSSPTTNTTKKSSSNRLRWSLGGWPRTHARQFYDAVASAVWRCCTFFPPHHVSVTRRMLKATNKRRVAWFWKMEDGIWCRLRHIFELETIFFEQFTVWDLNYYIKLCEKYSLSLGFWIIYTHANSIEFNFKKILVFLRKKYGLITKLVSQECSKQLSW